MNIVETIKYNRLPHLNHKLLSAISQRFSPRVFSSTEEISTPELAHIMQAAQLAPSSRNSQPWFYFIAQKDTTSFQKILTCIPEKHLWAASASCLIVACYSTNNLPINENELKWRYYDLGLSVMSAVLEAQHINIYTRQIGSFDTAKAKSIIGQENEWQPLIIMAMGKLGTNNDYQQTDKKIVEIDLEQHRRKEVISTMLEAE